MKRLLISTLLYLSLLSIGRGEPQGPGRQDQPWRPRPRAVQKYFQQLKEQDPEEVKRLRELRKSDPEAFRKELRMRGLNNPKPSGQHRGGRRADMEDYVARIRNTATPEERQQELVQIRKEISERIDRGLSLREEAINRLRNKLSKLEERHEKEKEHRDEMVDHQVRSLIEAAEKAPEQETP